MHKIEERKEGEKKKEDKEIGLAVMNWSHNHLTTKKKITSEWAL